MSLFLEIIEGENTGQRFRLDPGVRIGRTEGDILIQDAKVSSLHARVEKDKKGQLILVDKDSHNGLKISGQKVRRVALLPGVVFQVGGTFFKVVRLDGEKNDFKTKLESSGWKSALRAAISKVPAKNPLQRPLLRPFENVIELHFLEGIQANVTLSLGYGPRKFGSDVLDIELEEPLAPGMAFELIPVDNGIEFKTHHTDVVRFNNQAVETALVQPGDQIRIGGSLIKVTY
ncbi:MAG: FHA domain-containing protein [Bdellovibrio sp. CG10_big_fil_rev_8_21_14_0_10_47_8]|nr:MAG: FHA domain-containing protein [Bdellovibrio sp. CG10_big_fil_rev_8_21_14_0_10_47_8]